jgi:hypothetical protein
VSVPLAVGFVLLWGHQRGRSSPPSHVCPWSLPCRRSSVTSVASVVGFTCIWRWHLALELFLGQTSRYEWRIGKALLGGLNGTVCFPRRRIVCRTPDLQSDQGRSRRPRGSVWRGNHIEPSSFGLVNAILPMIYVVVGDEESFLAAAVATTRLSRRPAFRIGRSICLRRERNAAARGDALLPQRGILEARMRILTLLRRIPVVLPWQPKSTSQRFQLHCGPSSHSAEGPDSIVRSHGLAISSRPAGSSMNSRSTITWRSPAILNSARSNAACWRPTTCQRPTIS